MKSTRYSTTDQSRRQRTIPAERITFGIASLVVVILVGLVLLMWSIQNDRPPVLTVQNATAQSAAFQPGIVQTGIVQNPMEVRVESGQFYVPFTIKNTGGTAAESVQVIGELRQGDEILESGEQQIDFLASGETEEGAFVFSRDPRRTNLRIRVASYKLP